MSTVLAWRVRQVRGGPGAERFLVEFLDAKNVRSELWTGDGVERDEHQARDYAATLGVSAGAFRDAVARARHEFGPHQ